MQSSYRGVALFLDERFGIRKFVPTPTATLVEKSSVLLLMTGAARVCRTRWSCSYSFPRRGRRWCRGQICGRFNRARRQNGFLPVSSDSQLRRGCPAKNPFLGAYDKLQLPDRPRRRTRSPFVAHCPPRGKHPQSLPPKAEWRPRYGLAVHPDVEPFADVRHPITSSRVPISPVVRYDM